MHVHGGWRGDGGGIGATERAQPSIIMEGSNILGIQLFQNKCDTLNKDL